MEKEKINAHTHILKDNVFTEVQKIDVYSGSYAVIAPASIIFLGKKSVWGREGEGS